jgi:REP element-mobilizing transposase RayT
MAMTARGTHAGWRSRGYLPHCDAATAIQHIVFGLADSLPAPSLAAMPTRPDDRAAFADGVLDEGYGEKVLSGAAARIVQDCLLHEDGGRYRLIAWCIMPNHVHALAEQSQGGRLDEIVQTWKSVTAHRVNRLLNRAGPLWRREYFDRFMRSDEQLFSTRCYIEANPVSARLVSRPEDWPFSSAYQPPSQG